MIDAGKRNRASYKRCPTGDVRVNGDRWAYQRIVLPSDGGVGRGQPSCVGDATPSAVLSGVAKAARGGILAKRGGPLESLGSLDAAAFDKTGTLTEGDLVHIGKDDLFAEVDGPPLPDSVRSLIESLEQDGRTTMIVLRGDRYIGVIGPMDAPREASSRMIARLRELGIQRMIMISGDNQQVADAVAKEVGLDEARGDLMPDDKVAEIKKLQSEGGVAMVCDGVNDALAMASASFGIAMGAAGSNVALETADVALMADNLDHLPLAIGLSRATRRIIRQNLWMSLGMVAFLVPATILGLNIGPAVALHEGSKLIVVINALRLLAYKR